MQTIEESLSAWKAGLCAVVDRGELYRRNQKAHKWQAPFRSLVLRESLMWRMHDLLSQAHLLHEQGHTLGSRVLIRCALETVAMLAYVNELTKDVVAGKEDFHAYSAIMARLLIGSRNKTTKHESVNVLNLVRRFEKNYPGFLALYETLSETVHPNFESTCFGYSRVDHEKSTSTFSNNWVEMYADRHESAMRICIMAFEHEFEDEWPKHFACLEEWLVENDAELEATKGEGA